MRSIIPSSLAGAILATAVFVYAGPQDRSADASDLRGIWQAEVNANVNLEGHPEQAGVPAAKSVIVSPLNGRIPYKADALSRRQQNFEKRAEADPQTRCFQPGVPRATYMAEPFQIFQTEGKVVIVYQHVHAYRIIYTDSRPHYEGIEFYMGDSRGRWEENTLVVDVKNFMPGTWLDMAGNYHTEALRVVERYTRTGPNSMTYEAAIEDSNLFTSPWTVRVPLRRLTASDAQIVEDQCVEDAGGARRHVPPFKKR